MKYNNTKKYIENDDDGGVVVVVMMRVIQIFPWAFNSVPTR